MEIAEAELQQMARDNVEAVAAPPPSAEGRRAPVITAEMLQAKGIAVEAGGGDSGSENGDETSAAVAGGQGVSVGSAGGAPGSGSGDSSGGAAAASEAAENGAAGAAAAAAAAAAAPTTAGAAPAPADTDTDAPPELQYCSVIPLASLHAHSLYHGDLEVDGRKLTVTLSAPEPSMLFVDAIESATLQRFAGYCTLEWLHEQVEDSQWLNALAIPGPVTPHRSAAAAEVVPFLAVSEDTATAEADLPFRDEIPGVADDSVHVLTLHRVQVATGAAVDGGGSADDDDDDDDGDDESLVVPQLPPRKASLDTDVLCIVGAHIEDRFAIVTITRTGGALDRSKSKAAAAGTATSGDAAAKSNSGAAQRRHSLKKTDDPSTAILLIEACEMDTGEVFSGRCTVGWAAQGRGSVVKAAETGAAKAELVRDILARLRLADVDADGGANGNSGGGVSGHFKVVDGDGGDFDLPMLVLRPPFRPVAEDGDSESVTDAAVGADDEAARGGVEPGASAAAGAGAGGATAATAGAVTDSARLGAAEAEAAASTAASPSAATTPAAPAGTAASVSAAAVVAAPPEPKAEEAPADKPAPKPIPPPEGPVTLRYNHYKHQMTVDNVLGKGTGKVYVQEVKNVFSLSYAFHGNYKVHLRGPGGKKGPKLVQARDGTVRGLTIGEEYWLDIEEDAAAEAKVERKPYVPTVSSGASGAASFVKVGGGDAALGEDSASCSCLYGNPCVSAYNCKDWNNRFDVAKRNGWKGF